MRSFKVPLSKLNLALVGFNMNFDLRAPDYIFQVDDGFEIVYLRVPEDKQKQIDDWLEKIWQEIRRIEEIELKKYAEYLTEWYDRDKKP